MIRRAVRYELGMWRSLFRWVARRPPAEEGVAFGNAAKAVPLLWMFIGLSAAEVPILHLILPWPIVQAVSLVVGAYGVVWMVGLLAALKVHPHLVSAAGLRIRSGLSYDFTVPWDAVTAIRPHFRSTPPGGSVQVEDEGGRPVLLLGGIQTAVDLLLREPREVPVRKAADRRVVEIRFNADDPEALVREARRHIGAPSTVDTPS
jgi:hypothetical protein